MVKTIEIRKDYFFFSIILIYWFVLYCGFIF